MRQRRPRRGRLFDSLDELTDLPEDAVVLPGHFSDARPLTTGLGELHAETTNELLSHVADDDESAFGETIVEGLSDEPANYDEIKQISWGREQPGDDVEDLELGPNDCAADRRALHGSFGPGLEAWPPNGQSSDSPDSFGTTKVLPQPGQV